MASLQNNSLQLLPSSTSTQTRLKVGERDMTAILCWWSMLLGFFSLRTKRKDIMIKKMEYHKIKLLATQSWVYSKGWMTRTEDWLFFMTSPDMFGQDDSCWIWKKIMFLCRMILLDMEGNFVSLRRERGWKVCHGKIACRTAVKVKISIFTLVQKTETKHLILKKNKKKRRQISNEHNLNT